MDITTTSEVLLEKVYAEISKQALSNFEAQGLTQEEVDANMVLAKKSIDRDANMIVDLVVRSLSE